MTRETIILLNNKRKWTASLAAITTAFKGQEPVAPGSSSKAVQSLPSTIPMEEYVLGTAVPASYVQLGQNARTALATLSNAMNPVCSIYDKPSRHLYFACD